MTEKTTPAQDTTAAPQATAAGPSPTAPQELSVPVPGGELAVLRWPSADPGAPTVLALHGITANGASWARVAHHLAGRATLVAPDLRGRAGSEGLPGPWGIAAHAADAAALAAALGLRDAVLAGHSMGAFVAALTAVRTPEPFSRVVLVDGGIGFPPPPGLSGDALMRAVLGPAMERLSMTFPDRAAYRAFWQAHPAFAGGWDDWLERYVQRDLVPADEGGWRSSCRLEAIRTDGLDVFADDVLAAVHRLPIPGRLLWARRGLRDEPQGLYDEDRLAAARVEALRPREVAGTNHYTLLLGGTGARGVTDALLGAGEPAEAEPGVV